MSTVLIYLDNLFNFMCGCSPLVYVCVSVGMHEFACTHAYTCVHVCKGQVVIAGILCNSFLFLIFFRQNISLNLELIYTGWPLQSGNPSVLTWS